MRQATLQLVPEDLQALYFDGLRQARQDWQAWIQERDAQQQALMMARQILSHLALQPELQMHIDTLTDTAAPAELARKLDALRRTLLHLTADSALAPLQQELLQLLPRLWQDPEQQTGRAQKILTRVQQLAEGLQQDKLLQAAAEAEQVPWRLLEVLDQTLADLIPVQQGLLVSASASLLGQVQQTIPRFNWQNINIWSPEQVQGIPTVVLCDAACSEIEQTAMKKRFPEACLVLVLDMSQVPPGYCWSEHVDQVLARQHLTTGLLALLPRLLPRQSDFQQLAQDPATGLPTVSAGRQLFSQMQALAVRHQAPFCLAVVQWVNWQEYENQEGPFLMGEWLRKAVQTLEQSLRTVDVMLSWAPDKLVLLLPQTPLKGGLIALERCHQALQNMPAMLPAMASQPHLFQAGLLSSEQVSIYETALGKAWQLIPSQAAESRLFFDTDALAAPQIPHVLLVDDDPIIQQLLQFTYVHEGYQTTQLFQGDKKVLDILAEETISLIILDVKMPGMDGFEVLELIRSHHQYDRIPIVMLTSLKQEVDISRAFALGANDYLYKPFSPAELLIRTQRFLDL
ncbi:MAG: response regulator [Candidatus Sericytochromatia bacterium]|nr:response regulator [Candidatus Sericytochromatia bacterium]